MILGVPRNISGLTFGDKDVRTIYITGAGDYRIHQVRLPVARGVVCLRFRFCGVPLPADPPAFYPAHKYRP